VIDIENVESGYPRQSSEASSNRAGTLLQVQCYVVCEQRVVGAGPLPTLDVPDTLMGDCVRRFIRELVGRLLGPKEEGTRQCTSFPARSYKLCAISRTP
jgi:hypothetical protein